MAAPPLRCRIRATCVESDAFRLAQAVISPDPEGPPRGAATWSLGSRHCRMPLGPLQLQLQLRRTWCCVVSVVARTIRFLAYGHFPLKLTSVCRCICSASTTGVEHFSGDLSASRCWKAHSWRQFISGNKQRVYGRSPIALLVKNDFNVRDPWFAAYVKVYHGNSKGKAF
jgi:hypothetical protein